MKNKIFKDPVHGYIEIPRTYCSLLIDTPIFQRLRHIEQTSMRVLYPSAHHERFTHSLGVYHLGKTAFKHLQNNSEAQYPDFEWKKYQITFEIACLLHDCAHSPFSHTFENYYGKHKDLEGTLYKLARSAAFKKDYLNVPKTPATHEIVSAIIILEIFKEKIKKLGADPILTIRMVLGCTHSTPGNQKERIENCLISLLNSKTIDVDKLDYIIRDTWASGVSNVSIDIHRLLSAITIKENKEKLLVLAFHKSALSVIKSVIDGKNFLYQWIYGHHKVVYNNYLLQQSVESLNRVINRNLGKKDDYFLLKLFSLESFHRVIKIGQDSVYLPTDGDIFYLLKKYKDKIPKVDEVINRKHKCKPLWKTSAEFFCFFGELNEKNNLLSEKFVENHVRGILKQNNTDSFVYVKNKKPKIIDIQPNEVKVVVNDEIISYDRIFKTSTPANKQFIYIYVSEKAYKFKDKIIEELHKIK